MAGYPDGMEATVPGAGDTITVAVVRPTGQDPYGDPLPGSPTEIDIPGCLFAPGSTQEDDFRAVTASADGTVYAPAGVDVRPTDQMRIRGDLYSVVGYPQDWGRSGVVILVRRKTG